MKTNAVIHIVGIKCTPEGQDKVDAWYSEKHVPDLLKFKGIKGVTRYKVVSAAAEPSVGEASAEENPTFVTIYEFENYKDFEAYNVSPELEYARQDSAKILEETGTRLLWRVQCEVLKAWER